MPGSSPGMTAKTEVRSRKPYSSPSPSSAFALPPSLVRELRRTSRLYAADSEHLVTFFHGVGRHINLLAHRFELLAHQLHAVFGGERAGIVQPRRIIAHVLRNLHRAEFRPAHRAEMRHFVRLLGQRLVVILARGLRIEPEVELVLPAEVEARAREQIGRASCRERG